MDSEILVRTAHAKVRLLLRNLKPSEFTEEYTQVHRSTCVQQQNFKARNADGVDGSNRWLPLQGLPSGPQITQDHLNNKPLQLKLCGAAGL